MCVPGTSSRPAYVLAHARLLTLRPRRGAGLRKRRIGHLEVCQRTGWVRWHGRRERQRRARAAHACESQPAARGAGCPWRQRQLTKHSHVRRCAPTAPGCKPPATCSTSAGRCVRRRAHAAPVRQPCRVNLGDHVLCVLFRAPLNRNRLPPAALRVAGSRLDVPMPRAILPAAG